MPAEDNKALGEELTPSKQFVPYIIIADGPRAGTRFQLRDGDNAIGRSASGAVMLEDASVSRQHAVLTKSREGWILKDIGSKNGTLVNGQKIKDPVTIGHGDIIQTGIYSLRLITKPVGTEEELAPLPPEAEGKTVMVSKKQASAAPKTGEPATGDTRTMADSADTNQTTGALAMEKVEGAEELPEDFDEEEEPEGDEPMAEPQELPEKKRNPLITYGAMAAAVILVAAIGGYIYWKFLNRPAPSPAPTTPQVSEPSTPPAPVAPKDIPVFLDFASSPLSARVTMDGKDYGLTPVKINMDLEIGKTYTAEGSFSLDELQDSRTVKVPFTIEKDANLVPILFKGQIGILKIASLPRDTQLYIEGYYADDQFKAHTAKVTEVVFGKPIYVPYGKYTVELRQPKQIGETNQYIEDIRFRREFKITEDAPIFEINVSDEDLQKFPATIRSVPDKADVFMDAQAVGQTPYNGIFPLGEHTLTLRKDGYFEYTQTLKMDINTPYQAEVALKTTAAGEFINAGNALLLRGLYKGAVAQLSEVFKNSPTPREVAQTQYLLGSCYLHQGDLATALGYFEQARQNEDYKYQALLGLASIYITQKDTVKTLPLLVEVMLKAQDEQVKKDATALFQQASPLRSVMYIYTDPVGATVVVNDKEMPQKTPVILHDLGIGNYKVRVQKDGFVSQDLNINLSVNEFNPVIIKLKPVE